MLDTKYFFFWKKFGKYFFLVKNWFFRASCFGYRVMGVSPLLLPLIFLIRYYITQKTMWKGSENGDFGYGLNTTFQSTMDILQDSWEGSEKEIHPPKNLNPAHHLCSRVYVKNWLILRWKIKAPIAPGRVSYKQQKNIEKCMHENAKSSRGVANLSILHSITMCWNTF